MTVDLLEHSKLRGEVIIVFLSGPLRGHSYRPVGLNALWALVGAIASHGDPLCFEIKGSMTEPGYLGGFQDGEFCLFHCGDRSGFIVVLTPTIMETIGEPKVTINDQCSGMFFWIPRSAMVTFEEMARMGNALLLGDGKVIRTEIGQRYKNWTNDRYADYMPQAKSGGADE